MPHVGSPLRSSRTSRGAPPTRLLVPGERRPGELAVDLDRLRVELLAHGRERRVVPGEPQRRHHPERDRLAVREVVAGGRLERVTERVTEVELVARPAIVRIARGTPPP